MKNLLNLGKSLSKAEQRQILGGSAREDRGGCDPGNPNNSASGIINSPFCQCEAQGGRWDSECGVCRTDLYIASADCQIISSDPTMN